MQQNAPFCVLLPRPLPTAFSLSRVGMYAIVGCIVALIALFLNKNKKSFRKYPVFNSTFTLNTRTFRN